MSAATLAELAPTGVLRAGINMANFLLVSGKNAAGEIVAYIDDEGVERLSSSDSSSMATAWLGGRRQYRNEPLKAVLADVDRYTGKHFEVANTATGELQFTGTLDLNNSDAWLRALAIALPVTITRKANGVLLVSLNDNQKSSAFSQ